MPKVAPIVERKTDHLRINLEKDVRSALSSGLERYRFVHQALPELDLKSVDTSISVFGKTLRAPLLISSMTGGAVEAGPVNRVLAEAAQAAGIAMGVGSQRAALEHPDQAESFRIVRKTAPDILLFANLGAIQLNSGYATEECQRAVDMISADALILHLNPLQEALQPEGDTNWSGLLARIEKVCRTLAVPVIVKEVGWGISGDVAQKLSNAGVAAIDVAGAGGTSWSQVEMHRATDEQQARLAGSFAGWGIPTAESLCMAREAAPEAILFASGGLKDGLDAAKCIALGASLCGMAGPFLRAAADSPEALMKLLQLTADQLRVAMFACGAGDLAALRSVPLVKD